MGSRGHLDLVRRSNRARITLTVRKHGPISRVQSAEITGLSLACVGRIVNELISDGVLTEVGSVAGSRGRPMVLLDINPDGAPVAGFRLGPESIPIAVASPNSEILARKTITYEQDYQNIEEVLDAIVKGIQDCAESAGKDPRLLAGVGVAAAGIVDPLLGVIDNLTNRRGWENAPIVRLLEERLGVPVFADNDARAGALISHVFDSDSRGVSLYVYVGEGVGGAVVQGHDLLYGAHHAAGLFGHTTMVPDGPMCGCGNRGCLETVASDIAFIRYIWPEMGKTAADLPVADRTDIVRRGLQLAERGDAKAAWSLVTVTRYLGIGVANAIATIDPQSVTIFGTMIDIAPEWIIDLIRREVLQRIPARARGVEIKALPDYQEFMLRGATGLVLWQPYRALRTVEPSSRLRVARS